MDTTSDTAGQDNFAFERFGSTYHLKIETHKDLEKVLKNYEAFTGTALEVK